jgi:hypothetical protein
MKPVDFVIHACLLINEVAKLLAREEPLCASAEMISRGHATSINRSDGPRMVRLMIMNLGAKLNPQSAIGEGTTWSVSVQNETSD